MKSLKRAAVSLACSEADGVRFGALLIAGKKNWKILFGIIFWNALKKRRGADAVKRA